MNDVEAKINRSSEVENPKDLATCNRLLLDQQRLEDQLENRKQELDTIRKGGLIKLVNDGSSEDLKLKKQS